MEMLVIWDAIMLIMTSLLWLNIFYTVIALMQNMSVSLV